MLPLRGLAQTRDDIADARRQAKSYLERFEFKADLKIPDETRAAYDLHMIYVPAGQFTARGEGDRAGTANAPPVVKVSAFWMSRCEVTTALVELWYSSLRSQDDRARAILEKLPKPEGMYFFPDYRHDDDPDETRPATGLTQYAAQHFCQWLSLRTKRTYRLPTDAEWEYAARAGTDAPWPCGDDAKRLGEYAWFGKELKTGSHPVGRKKPNAWGFCDMSGNAGEWVLDGWSGDRGVMPGKVAVDPWVRRKAGEPFGVVRGGDWTGAAEATRVWERRRANDWHGKGWYDGWRWYDLSDDGRRVGFRVVSPAAPERDGRESYLTLPARD